MMHILVVDDNPADRELIRRLLSGCPRPLRVSEAGSGADALRACLDDPQAPPDCVLLDYFLPDYGAPELLASLGSADCPCCPVVILTDCPGLIDHRAMLRHGAQDVIGKDSRNAQGLKRCLENAVERFGMMRELRRRDGGVLRWVKESEWRWRQLAEAMPHQVWTCTPDGACDYLSPQPSKAEVLVRQPEVFSSPTQPGGGDLSALVKRHLDTAFRDGNHRLEWLLRRLDGTEVPIEILLTCIVFKGKPVLQASARDISERRRMMAALAQAMEAAEQASQAKSRFLANMSHEIRTPMTAIMGLTQLCLATRPNARQRNYLTKIHGAAAALLRIIDDILDFSTTASRRMTRPGCSNPSTRSTPLRPAVLAAPAWAWRSAAGWRG